MCTVVLRVPDDPAEPVRLLAVRDEDPSRPWDPLGAWWPDAHPGVVGVRDVRAGGAWLAADPEARRLAVILNRAEVTGAAGSRGTVVLDAVAGDPPADRPDTNGFNLVEVDAAGARVTSWDGTDLRRRQLEPGVHMIAHDDVDDPETARIARWLPEFAATDAGAVTDDDGWMRLLERTATLDPTDDRAIVRDNRAHGYPTLSLLVCEATVGPDGVDIAYGELDRPGHWNHPHLHGPLDTPSRPEAPAS
jgi:uncharacterized protein with NRDE domain